MARRRNSQNPLKDVLNSRWPAWAIVAAGMLVIGYGILPAILGTNPLTARFLPYGRDVFGLLGLLIGMVAIFRFTVESTPKKPMPPPKDASIAEVYTQRGHGGIITQTPKDAWENPEPITILPTDEAWGHPLPVSRFPLAPYPPSKPTDWSLELLQSIEWKRFEELCVAYYREKGIRAETTYLDGEGGVDIRLYQEVMNPKPSSIVRCKAWGDKWIGVKPIRDLLDTKIQETVAKGVFMTPGGFTDDARKFAEANRIILLDGKHFLEMLKHLPEGRSMQLLAVAIKGNYTIPTCPRCEMKMVHRKGPMGDFWGCRNYPTCVQNLPMVIPYKYG
jgi:restriction system protein